ncbi:MAG: hypothetical protein JNJ99_15805 [Crocinitomicaceae bacterium]|nr:hypothetical protein [Crocinitomicaceae bacterium]
MTENADDSEDFVFRIKSKFFQEIPHPKIIQKYIAQLDQKCGNVTPFVESVIDFGSADLAYILKNYTQEIIQLKSHLAKETEVCKMKIILEKIHCLHWSVLLRLLTYLPSLESYPDKHLRQSQALNAFEMYRLIEKSGLKEDEIKTYICNEIQTVNPEIFSAITNGCLTSRKIVLNV